jgi:hypothetical protein
MSGEGGVLRRCTAARQRDVTMGGEGDEHKAETYLGRLGHKGCNCSQELELGGRQLVLSTGSSSFARHYGNVILRPVSSAVHQKQQLDRRFLTNLVSWE